MSARNAGNLLKFRLESLTRIVLSLVYGRPGLNQSADRLTKQLHEEKELLNQIQIQLNQKYALQVTLPAAAEDGSESSPSVTDSFQSVKPLAEVLGQLLREYDGGPLCLKEQTRIAVRTELGGRRFRARVSLLPLPPPLREYILAARCDSRIGWFTDYYILG